MFGDAIESHYVYVRDRIKTFNPNRIVKGIVNAQDWPPKKVEPDAFYLLVLDDAPIGSQGYSQYQPMIFHQLQWVWINKGTDIVPGVRKANRGDRYNVSQNMKGELLYGLAPGYTQKLSWSLDGNGKLVSSIPDIPEPITWNPVAFHTKLDKDSGINYGAGALRVWDMTDAITS